MKKLKNWWKYERWLLLILSWLLIYKFIKRSDLIEVVRRALPGEEGALLAGMVWGEEGAISRGLYQQLRETGLIHLVVVSGANLMMVGKMVIEGMARYLGRKEAIVWGGGVILLYVNLVGWQIPVLRAVIFLGILYWGQLLGRRFMAGRALVLTVGIMLIANWEVVKSASFWLSMAAFVAVLGLRREGNIKTSIGVSLMTLPIISLLFGRISLIGPVMNLGVIILVELITIIGFGGSLVALICFPIGQGILRLSYPFLRYLVEITGLVGEGWGLNFSFNWWMVVGWYLIIGGYWYGRQKI